MNVRLLIFDFRVPLLLAGYLNSNYDWIKLSTYLRQQSQLLCTDWSAIPLLFLLQVRDECGNMLQQFFVMNQQLVGASLEQIQWI